MFFFENVTVPNFRYDQAISIFRQLLGSNHPELALIRCNKSAVLAQMGRVNEAVTAATMGYRAAKIRFTRNHPKLLMYITNLARCLELKGTKLAKQECIPLFLEAAELISTSLSVRSTLFDVNDNFAFVSSRLLLFCIVVFSQPRTASVICLRFRVQSTNPPQC